jgi:uncharacterized membrane protein YedE/YeeE
MTEFTPISGTVGGLLIGLAASTLLLANGRVAGISGVLGGLLRSGASNERGWRAAFLIGLPLGAALVSFATGPIVSEISAPPTVVVVAGLLVGFGTRLGNGCTSGHGVCGIARGSQRSIAATAVFMAVAGVTVFVSRHLLGAIG